MTAKEFAAMLDGRQYLKEITKEEVYSDYELMNAKCREIDELKGKIDENFEKLIELDE